jgi:hypothetical protein
MKKILLLSALQLVFSIAFAQPSPEQRIQDSVIGWWKKSIISQLRFFFILDDYKWVGTDFRTVNGGLNSA